MLVLIRSRSHWPWEVNTLQHTMATQQQRIRVQGQLDFETSLVWGFVCVCVVAIVVVAVSREEGYELVDGNWLFYEKVLGGWCGCGYDEKVWRLYSYSAVVHTVGPAGSS